MPAKHFRYIARTSPLATWAEQQVARGDHASISDGVAAYRPCPDFPETDDEVTICD